MVVPAPDADPAHTRCNPDSEEKAPHQFGTQAHALLSPRNRAACRYLAWRNKEKVGRLGTSSDAALEYLNWIGANNELFLFEDARKFTSHFSPPSPI